MLGTRWDLKKYLILKTLKVVLIMRIKFLVYASNKFFVLSLLSHRYSEGVVDYFDL